MAHCKAAELADRAVELHALITQADLEALKAKDDSIRSAALQAQLENYHRDLQKTEADACRRYAASDKGALYQAIAARDAVSILRSSNMDEARRQEFLTRIDRALESIERFFSGKSNQLAVLKAICRTGSRRAGQTDLVSIAEKVKAAIAASRTWADLQSALAAHDLELEPVGSGLFVRVRSTKAHVAKASAVGLRYAVAMRKFGAEFPGHPATWLAEKILGHHPN